MNTEMTLFTITLTLFFIMDPLGNLQSFMTLMNQTDPQKQKLVIMRELLIALAMMLLFNFLGEVIFSFLELSETSVRLSAGVILFLIAIKILFPTPDSLRCNLPAGEPFIIPLAIPLIAGPGLLATIMLYANLEHCQTMTVVAIILAWLGTGIVLLLSRPLYRLLGKNGLSACEKLIGMVLVMIAIQRFMEGVQQIIAARA